MIKVFLSLASIFFMLFSSQVCFADSLNNRQRRLSVEYLYQTPTGQNLLRHFQNNEDILSVLIIDEPNSPTPPKLFDVSHNSSSHHKVLITMNSDVLASASVFYSWILAQALVDYEIHQIELQFGVGPIGEFIERTQWQMIVAQKHWLEMGSPNQFDPMRDPNVNLQNEIRRHKASVSSWDRVWRSSISDFLSSAKRRHIQLGYQNVGINTLVDESFGNRKEMAMLLQRRFNALVNDECSQRGEDCSL